MQILLLGTQECESGKLFLWRYLGLVLLLLGDGNAPLLGQSLHCELLLVRTSWQRMESKGAGLKRK